MFGDHITAIKIITADGQCRWIERGANNTEDADLFWAVLGGSPGNYAVLTHIKLKTHRSDAHPHARGLQLVLPYSTDSMRTLLEVNLRSFRPARQRLQQASARDMEWLPASTACNMGQLSDQPAGAVHASCHALA